MEKYVLRFKFQVGTNFNISNKTLHCCLYKSEPPKNYTSTFQILNNFVTKNNKLGVRL